MQLAFHSVKDTIVNPLLMALHIQSAPTCPMVDASVVPFGANPHHHVGVHQSHYSFCHVSSTGPSATASEPFCSGFSGEVFQTFLEGQEFFVAP